MASRFTHILRKSALVLLCSAVGCILLVCLLLGALSIYLTPQRLAAIVNREASKYLRADITTHNISYTLWSTFPKFTLHTDSISVVSKSLEPLSPQERKALPENAAHLASLKSISAEINVLDLLKNRYVFHNVKVERLSANLVAVNDSVANYNIFPSIGGSVKNIPYFSCESVALDNPGTITYTSLASDSHASLNLSNLLLKRTRNSHRENSYRLSLAGNLSAQASGLHILSHFPFSLDGDIRLQFKPFGVDVYDYDINLGNIRSTLNMSLGIGSDIPDIHRFDYHISSINLMTLLHYLPPELVPSLAGLEAQLPMTASATLTSPWHFSSESFPSLRIDVTIPEGEIAYTYAPGIASKAHSKAHSKATTYSIHHSPINASFNFDSHNPSLSTVNLQKCNFTGEGVNLSLDAEISRLTQKPLVDINVDVASDIATTLHDFPILQHIAAKGSLQANSHIRFSLNALSQQGIAQGLFNFAANTRIKARNLNIDAPKAGITASLASLTLLLSDAADSLTPQGIQNLANNISGSLAGLNASTAKGAFAIDSLIFDVAPSFHHTLTKSNTARGLAGALADGLHLSLHSLDCNTPSLSANVKNLETTLKLSPGTSHAHGLSSPTHTPCSLVEGEASLVPATAHATVAAGNPYGLPATPELISPKIPDGVKDFLCRYSFSALATCTDCRISNKGGITLLRNLDLSASNDSVTLRNANIETQATKATVSGSVSNISPFLLLPPSASNPIKANLDVALGVVNINALARAYVDSKGGIGNIPTHPDVTPDDSVALLIPRNIEASIHASASETIYTNLHLYDLDTDVDIKHGVASVPHLTISSDFGQGELGFMYDTQNIQNLNFSANAALSQINIVNFFKNFHTLLLMMPQMKNLSGIISAQASLSGRLFPDMYINTPAFIADVAVQGRGLTVHQDPFIRHITEMMLIRNDGDIHIQNLDVNAHVYNNLLQLDPFNFEFDRYKLKMQGINNFNGDLYYHIAVLKSPVPFPFSINVEHIFRHPKLTFGGPRYDIKHAEEITSSIQENNNFNIVATMHRFIREFIRKAAESDSIPPSERLEEAQ